LPLAIFAAATFCSLLYADWLRLSSVLYFFLNFDSAHSAHAGGAYFEYWCSKGMM
jgi:hypothetical protein